MADSQQHNSNPDKPLDLSCTETQCSENSTNEKSPDEPLDLSSTEKQCSENSTDEKFPDEPLDLSSTEKQCLENSTDEKSISSSNELEAASCTDIEKPAINTTDPQTPTYGKHKLPINETSKHSLSQRIQPSKSKQIPVASPQLQSQVNNDHAEKTSSSQASGSAAGSSSKEKSPKSNRFSEKQLEILVEACEKNKNPSHSTKTKLASELDVEYNQVHYNDHAEQTSSLQTSGLAAGSSSKEKSPKSSRFSEKQLEILVEAYEKNENPSHSTKTKLASELDVEYNQVHDNDHAEKASSLQASGSAAGSPYKGKSPKSFRFSENQLEILVEAYEKNKNPSHSTKTKLASELDVEYNQVHNWFYRRLKYPKKEAQNQAREPQPSPRKWHQCNRKEQDWLEGEFKNNPYPARKVQGDLAEMTNLTTRQVIHWFKNRRKLEKKKRNQPPNEPSEQESD